MMKLDLFLLVFLGIVLYVTLLFIAKSIGWCKKKLFENCTNACPKNNPLNRIARKKTDHLVINFTFSVFDFKRYQCSECEWQGLNGKIIQKKN